MHSSHPLLSHKMCFADKKIWGLEKKRGWWKLSTLLDEVKSSSRKWFTSLTLWDRREDQLENPVLTVCEVRKKSLMMLRHHGCRVLEKFGGKGRFGYEHRFSKQNHSWAQIYKFKPSSSQTTKKYENRKGYLHFPSLRQYFQWKMSRNTSI